ncbi:hypothetical protein Tco_1314920 [Tanacetum coccineum]
MVMSHVMIITWNHSDQKELSDEYYTKKFHKVNKEDRRDDDKLRRHLLLLNVSHYKLRSLSESVGSSFSLDELQANGMLQLPTSVEME